jgi:hypothetical protein
MSAGIGLFAMPKRQTRYFHPGAEAKKDRADPDVFRGQKHQYAAQNDQENG